MNFSPIFSPIFSADKLFNGLSHIAYLLVIHGSRDPRPLKSATVLAQQLQGVFGQNCLVEVASLECTDSPLHQQIVAFGDRALSQGCQSLKIVPLFLLPGVHVGEDIPDEVAIAQDALARKGLGNRLSVDILPYLGSYPGMRDFLAQKIKYDGLQDAGATSATVAAPHMILLSHGSRRAGGNQPIEAIAAHIGATPAYWAVNPKLPEQIRLMTTRDNRPMMVIPYFLFAGGITDAIAQTIDQLNREGLSAPIILGEPLGANPKLVTLIATQLLQWLSLEPAQTIGHAQQNLIHSNTIKC